MTALALVAGCARIADIVPGLSRPGADRGASAGIEEDTGTRPRARPDGMSRSAAALDTASPESRNAAAQDAAAPAQRLGSTVATLGAPGEEGFWIKTPLADAPGRGRVYYPGSDKSVGVDLIPLDAAPGAGSRLSLSAMRMLDAPLSGLPEVDVFRLTE